MNELKHTGTKRHSGRYPYGSGGDPNQHGSSSILSISNTLKNKGFSEAEISKSLNISSTELRKRRSLEYHEKRAADVAHAIRLKDKGYTPTQIGKIMNRNESSVRSLLNPVLKKRAESINEMSDILKENVKAKKYIDIGAGTELYLNTTQTKMKKAIQKLQDDGYEVHKLKIKQLGTNKDTTMLVLASPGTTKSDVFKNRQDISIIGVKSVNSIKNKLGLEPIESVSSKRIHIRYREDGGHLKDGVIEIRPGVDDISLGKDQYSQVRIGVDNTHYLKGMAIYANDIPKGKDIIFNTNKSKNVPPHKVFKTMEDDKDNPFGTTIKPGGQRRAINKVYGEGDWDHWSIGISSQVLSKQPVSLASEQLTKKYNTLKKEYDDISKLTNPTVKNKLLISFANKCDSEAVDLKAAGLPRQANKVILPLTKIKPTEVYAPTFNNGERVVLIRYPHSGRFEIPELIVNNKNPEAKSLFKNAKDAIGIHPSVAERLSGADFDGDSVVVIPNNHKKIKTSDPLIGLKNFDPKEMYPAYPGMEPVSQKTAFKTRQMGDISNLITDMQVGTVGGKATKAEIAAATRHSMVVIDAGKHQLNYKQSYIDNGIANLKKKYQGKANAGASTLISKASSQKRIDGKLVRSTIDPITGKKINIYKEESYINKKGKITKVSTKSTKMAETDDAFSLSSGTLMENVYAKYANSLKALGNKSRLDSLKNKDILYNPSAHKTYRKEVDSINNKLIIALKNSPLERKAQILAGVIVKEKKLNNLDIEPEKLKKIKGQALAEARVRVGAKKDSIKLTDKEWEAIQHGAITKTKLKQILDNADEDQIKNLAMPLEKKGLTNYQQFRISNMYDRGLTQAEIANALGISVNQVSEAL